MPTPAESQLLAAYIHDRSTCTDLHLPEIAKVDISSASEPAGGVRPCRLAGQLLTQAYADIKATQLFLVNRQLNWGEGARWSNQQTIEAAREKLRTPGVSDCRKAHTQHFRSRPWWRGAPSLKSLAWSQRPSVRQVSMSDIGVVENPFGSPYP